MAEQPHNERAGVYQSDRDVLLDHVNFGDSQAQEEVHLEPELIDEAPAQAPQNAQVAARPVVPQVTQPSRIKRIWNGTKSVCGSVCGNIYTLGGYTTGHPTAAKIRNWTVGLGLTGLLVAGLGKQTYNSFGDEVYDDTLTGGHQVEYTENVGFFSGRDVLEVDSGGVEYKFINHRGRIPIAGKYSDVNLANSRVDRLEVELSDGTEYSFDRDEIKGKDSVDRQNTLKVLGYADKSFGVIKQAIIDQRSGKYNADVAEVIKNLPYQSKPKTAKSK